MENKGAYVASFHFCLYIFFLLKWDFLSNHFVSKPSKRHYKYIFYQPTHLKRQSDVLHDKMGMDVAPYFP